MISCLMVTLPVAERSAFAQRSIRSYCDQTYPDRELVVIVDGGEAAARSNLVSFVQSLGRHDIRIHETDEGATLGALRNRSLELAAGDIVCQWDDDDLYHPERLERQAALLNADDLEAVFIQELIQYFPQRRRMYLTNWRATEVGGHPGTLMARKSDALVYPENGASARLGEDLVAALNLVGRRRVGHLRDHPCLYIYVSHGANSWDEQHHEMLSRELCVSQGLLRRREGGIREALAVLDLPRGKIGLYGANGHGFDVER